MSSSTPPKPDFVPIESIVAFVFIGVMILTGLIARCIALNHSTLRNTQSTNLMIYKPAPKPNPQPRARRLSTEENTHSNSDSRDPSISSDDPVKQVRVQRGPKNL